jgi:ADP-L-glycero-D-manno-heptose 6-epimerase
MDECQDRRIPIQISSSASVYGPNNTTFRETDDIYPVNLYAKSKAAIETYFEMIYPVSPIQIFRYFNVYGPCEDHKGEQASPFHKFHEQAKTGTIKLFVGSDKFRRDFIHVDEVINIHKAFFDIDESGIWNIGTGETLSFNDVASLVGAEFSAKIEYIPMPEQLQAAYQKFTRADITKLRSTLG